MLGASEFSKHISYVTYNILYKYNNDLLKASKHALVEVALQRKNNPFPSARAFVKAIYTDSKIYYLDGLVSI